MNPGDLGAACPAVNDVGPRVRAPTAPSTYDRQPSAAWTDPMPYRLTVRECQLIALVRRGLSNREIAAELGLAEQTVKNYLVVLCEKVGVRNRTQLALADDVRESSRRRG